MNFEYTYTYRLRQEIINREKEIANLKIEVRNIIMDKDPFTVRKKYDELCEKWETFADFKKERENNIKEYFLKKFQNITNKYRDIIYDEIKNRKIPKDKGNRLYLKLNKVPQDIQNEKFDDVSILGANIFSHIFTTPHVTEKEMDFIIEFYNYTGVSLSCLYENNQTFVKMPEEVKVRCLQDALKEVCRGLRDSLIANEFNSSYYFMLAEILEDKDVKSFVNKEYGPEKTNITNTARLLREHFPVSDEILEDSKKMPKAIEKFIKATEKLNEREIAEKDLEL